MLKLFVALFCNKVDEPIQTTKEKGPSILVLICLWVLAAIVVTGGIMGLVLEPAYFISFETLKGALISIVIGILIYAFVVRKAAFFEKRGWQFCVP